MGRFGSIIPLGTVSPYLKDDRNCPGFLVAYIGDEKTHYILLDCGNGCSKYLDFPYILEDLDVIITHYHKDHYGELGLIQYASYVYHNMGRLNDKIKIHLPKEEYEGSKTNILETQEAWADYFDITDGSVITIEDLKITFRDNHSHSINSFMVKLQNDEETVVYTSDVGNTNIDDIVEFAKDADLLICESSLLTSHKKTPNEPSFHLTAKEAGQIAKMANVKRLILTHFFPEIDPYSYLKEAFESFEDINIASAKEGYTIFLDKGKRIKKR